MSLLVVPSIDRGIQAVFCKRIVPAFQRIRRCSQRCNGVPLEKRVVRSEDPAIVWPAGVVTSRLVRAELRVVDAAVRFRSAVADLGVLPQIWLVSATDG